MRQELGVLDMFHVLIVVTLEVRVGIPRSPTVLHREAKPSRETVCAAAKERKWFIWKHVTISLTSGAGERSAASSPNNAWRGSNVIIAC